MTASTSVNVMKAGTSLRRTELGDDHEDRRCTRASRGSFFSDSMSSPA